MAKGNHGCVTTSDTYTASLHNTRLANGNGTHRGASLRLPHDAPRIDAALAAAGAREAARIVRAARLRDLLASIAEWERASGSDRVWWRRDARHRLAEWRRLHAIPERAAFQAAVARRAAG